MTAAVEVAKNAANVETSVSFMMKESPVYNNFQEGSGEK
jgi:hypothetical protein